MSVMWPATSPEIVRRGYVNSATWSFIAGSRSHTRLTASADPPVTNEH